MFVRVTFVVMLAIATGSLAFGQSSESSRVPLKLDLPRPAFKGTPKNAPAGVRLEKPRKGKRPALLVPDGTTRVSHERTVSSSDTFPIIGELTMTTDGKRDAVEGQYVELGPGVQWVQIDLGSTREIHAVLIWHYHLSARVYHDVIVQVSDDAKFKRGVTTIFNNDHDGSAKLGIGKDLEYWETYEGKLVDARGEKARYLRLLSNGNTDDDQNHYTEVDVFAR